MKLWWTGDSWVYRPIMLCSLLSEWMDEWVIECVEYMHLTLMLYNVKVEALPPFSLRLHDVRMDSTSCTFLVGYVFSLWRKRTDRRIKSTIFPPYFWGLSNSEQFADHSRNSTWHLGCDVLRQISPSCCSRKFLILWEIKRYKIFIAFNFERFFFECFAFHWRTLSEIKKKTRQTFCGHDDIKIFLDWLFGLNQPLRSADDW